MLETGIAVVIGVGLLLIFGFARMSRRRQKPPATFADEREERLAKRLARTVGCSPEQALPSVRREITLAPSLADEPLFKRALYHYRQDLPEKICAVYRDRAVG